MTFEKALNLPSEVGYTEKYQAIIQALGFENVKRCIPFSEERIKEAYKTDRNLNNLDIHTWDMAAGFATGWQGKCIPIGSSLSRLCYKKLKVNSYSCAEGVCILKECAAMIAEGRC